MELGWMHCTQGGCGTGGKARMEIGSEKDSLQQLGADKHKYIMHQLDSHRYQEILPKSLAQGFY